MSFLHVFPEMVWVYQAYNPLTLFWNTDISLLCTLFWFFSLNVMSYKSFLICTHRFTSFLMGALDSIAWPYDTWFNTPLLTDIWLMVLFSFLWLQTALVSNFVNLYFYTWLSVEWINNRVHLYILIDTARLHFIPVYVLIISARL